MLKSPKMSTKWTDTREFLGEICEIGQSVQDYGALRLLSGRWDIPDMSNYRGKVDYPSGITVVANNRITDRDLNLASLFSDTIVKYGQSIVEAGRRLRVTRTEQYIHGSVEQLGRVIGPPGRGLRTAIMLPSPSRSHQTLTRLCRGTTDSRPQENNVPSSCWR